MIADISNPFGQSKGWPHDPEQEGLPNPSDDP